MARPRRKNAESNKDGESAALKSSTGRDDRINQGSQEGEPARATPETTASDHEEGVNDAEAPTTTTLPRKDDADACDSPVIPVVDVYNRPAVSPKTSKHADKSPEAKAKAEKKVTRPPKCPVCEHKPGHEDKRGKSVLCPNCRREVTII